MSEKFRFLKTANWEIEADEWVMTMAP